MASTRHTRILILGGGFGGVYTAMMLEKCFRRDANVDIALVSKENYLTISTHAAGSDFRQHRLA